MSDDKPAPLDLSAFDDLDTPPSLPVVAAPVTAPVVAGGDPRLAAEPEPERLVEVANLKPEAPAAARASAAKIDFRNTTALLAHGEGVLAGVAQSSRHISPGVRLGAPGEVGQV